jgi:CopG family nickel-responsive transcriptional regulator
MKDPLVRFGVAIEGSLLKEIDALTRERGCTRSELFRDLSRAEVGRAKVKRGVGAVCAFTLVYDHHVRDLGKKLTEVQHELGDGVRAALHIHLTHDLCLEVIIMQGQSDRLQAVTERILAMRGVKQGGVEMIASPGAAHGHAHGHAHDDGHVHRHGPAASLSAGGTGRSSASGRGSGGRRGAPAKNGSRGSRAARPRRARTPRA